VARIDDVLAAMRAGTIREHRYESVRKGQTLRVTISPWESEGRLIGYIQTIVPQS